MLKIKTHSGFQIYFLNILQLTFNKEAVKYYANQIAKKDCVGYPPYFWKAPPPKKNQFTPN